MLLLFGTTIVNYLGSSSKKITEQKELTKYEGYVVKKLKTDVFGNWIIAKKGREAVVLRCDDAIFSSLSVSDPLAE